LNGNLPAKLQISYQEGPVKNTYDLYHLTNQENAEFHDHLMSIGYIKLLIAKQ